MTLNSVKKRIRRGLAKNLDEYDFGNKETRAIPMTIKYDCYLFKLFDRG